VLLVIVSNQEYLHDGIRGVEETSIKPEIARRLKQSS